MNTLRHLLAKTIKSENSKVEKFAKVVVKGILPPMVNPAAMPIMLASAMPHWIKRSGKDFMKAFSFIEPAKSAVRATTFGLDLPNSNIPSPKPLLVSFCPVT